MPGTPFVEGCRQERETFLALRGAPQAAALRHIFFAERRAQSTGSRFSEPPQTITAAVVVGGGNMGASIAYALATLEIEVTIVETDAAGAQRARDNVARLYGQAVKRGKMSAEAAQQAQDALFRVQVGYADLPQADIAIEAAFEDMGIKQQIFAQLDAALPKNAILATNTSYLNVNQIAAEISHPERVLGLHFFSPAHIMALLEVVKAEKTSVEVLSTAYGLAKRMRKIPVAAGVCDGFIGNRILTRYRQTTDIVMLEGALPWEIDAAMRAFGFAMGPYEVQDLSGLDIAYANRQRLGWSDMSDFRYIPIADRLVEELKRLGRKTSAGWYDYPESGKGLQSQAVEDIVIETARAAGVARKEFTETEIAERALAAMVEEGCRILEEGIADRPADIDLVMVHGYAFPRWRGGVMCHADTVGLPDILRRIEAYAAEDPLSWSPPDLLRRLVQSGQNFDSLN
ncbi:MAG: 3-hydroxyacyl-CoA dehydrogenase NAD-binding domain-containing protein [Magnetospiraceae bacterium]